MAIWICADIHGYYDIYEQINNFIAPEDRVEFLGDAIDRGPDSYKTMKAIRENPQWDYYRGNHEALLADALEEHLEDLKEDPHANGCNNWSYHCCLNNGALYKDHPPAFRQIIEQGEEAVVDWLQYLRGYTYLYAVFKNKNFDHIHVSHAGTSIPDYAKIDDNGSNYLWDREHIYENVNSKYPNSLVIHGHTPISYIQDLIKGRTIGICQTDEPVFYQKNKLDIDAGVFYTGKVHLIKLDTLAPNYVEYHTFVTKEDLYGTR